MGKGVWRWGKRERESIYLSLCCHHQNDSCIKVGSNESHFNVPVGSGGQSHKTVSTNHNLSEEKGKLKWYLNEVLLLTTGFQSLLGFYRFTTDLMTRPFLRSHVCHKHKLHSALFIFLSTVVKMLDGCYRC